MKAGNEDFIGRELGARPQLTCNNKFFTLPSCNKFLSKAIAVIRFFYWIPGATCGCGATRGCAGVGAVSCGCGCT
jgi:hypothetical protein